MPSSRYLQSPDLLQRDVLFAVELVDPVSQTLVHSGVEVAAVGLSRAPIVSYSGRFVWLREGERWPERVSVTPLDVPLASHVAPAPPRPSDLSLALPNERLLRIQLRPTAAYAFDFGVTAVRGRVVEGPERDSPPVVGALVELAWFDLDGGSWQPEPPASMGSAAASPPQAETDDHGEFAVFLRLNPPRAAQPDLVSGQLRARLQVTRDSGAGAATRVTAQTFEFVSDQQTGRLPEGRPLARDIKLEWTELSTI